MACPLCKKIEHSFSLKPFIPPKGLTHDTYVCPCGQRWWRYNGHYHLWSRIDDDATWQNILNGCQTVIAIGNPSRNVG